MEPGGVSFDGAELSAWRSPPVSSHLLGTRCSGCRRPAPNDCSAVHDAREPELRDGRTGGHRDRGSREAKEDTGRAANPGEEAGRRIATVPSGLADDPPVLPEDQGSSIRIGSPGKWAL